MCLEIQFLLFFMFMYLNLEPEGGVVKRTPLTKMIINLNSLCLSHSKRFLSSLQFEKTKISSILWIFLNISYLVYLLFKKGFASRFLYFLSIDSIKKSSFGKRMRPHLCQNLPFSWILINKLPFMRHFKVK